MLTSHFAETAEKRKKRKLLHMYNKVPRAARWFLQLITKNYYAMIRLSINDTQKSRLFRNLKTETYSRIKRTDETHIVPASLKAHSIWTEIRGLTTERSPRVCCTPSPRPHSQSANLVNLHNYSAYSTTWAPVSFPGKRWVAWCTGHDVNLLNNYFFGLIRAMSHDVVLSSKMRLQHHN